MSLPRGTYFGLYRKYVDAFGSLFDNFYVDRVDENGVRQRSVKVPIRFGPAERYMVRAEQNPDLTRPISYTYPMMAYEVVSVNPDPSRQLNPVTQNVFGSNFVDAVTTQRNPIPYDLKFTLYAIARNTDDVQQIVEQVLPWFTPQLAWDMTLIAQTGEQRSVQLFLDGAQPHEQYEGQPDSKEFVVWDFNFTMKAFFFPPVSKQGVIKHVEVDFYVPTTDTAAEGVGVTHVQEYVTAQPGLDANGNPTDLLANSIPYSQISANSNYGVVESTYSNDPQEGSPTARAARANTTWYNILMD